MKTIIAILIVLLIIAALIYHVYDPSPDQWYNFWKR